PDRHDGAMDPSTVLAIAPGDASIPVEAATGVTLVLMVWVGLFILRKLVSYLLSGGAVVAAAAAALGVFYVRPSHVFAWIDRQADQLRSSLPDSEGMVDASGEATDSIRQAIER